jgi:beta-phosphoglucomutase family hydrolase
VNGPIAALPVPRGVLFDLDGVVVASGPAHAHAWTRLFAEHGVDFGPTDYEAVALGKPREAVIRAVLGELPPDEHARLMARKPVFVEQFIAAHGLSCIPGTMPVVDALEERGIPFAIATSSRTPELLLDGAGVLDRFPVRVDRSQVERGKPHPDLFLAAADRLGLPPEECWVVEDAEVGVSAGLAAGCTVIGLAVDGPDASLSAAHAVVADLSAVLPVLLRESNRRGD